MLMMTIRRRGMGKGTARRHKANTIYTQTISERGRRLWFVRVRRSWSESAHLAYHYAVPQRLSTDGCSRLLQIVSLGERSGHHLHRPLSERVDIRGTGGRGRRARVPDDAHATANNAPSPTIVGVR